jgi:hypothetical protein
MDPGKDSEKIYRDICKSAIEICEQIFADYNFKLLRYMNKFNP